MSYLCRISQIFGMKLLALLLLPFAYCANVQIMRMASGCTLSEGDSSLLHSSHVSSLISYLMGVQSQKPEGWLGSCDILSRAEATALIIVAGQGQNFKLPLNCVYDAAIKDDHLNPDLAELMDVMTSQYNSGVTLIDSSEEGVVGTHGQELESMISGSQLQTKSPALRTELMNLNAISAWLHQSRAEVVNEVPDLYEINIEGLHSLTDNTLREGIKETAQVIQQFSAVLDKVYSGNVNVVVLTTAQHARTKRQINAQASNTMTDYEFYDVNYPVIFHMALWTSLTLAISVLVVSCGLWFMDPGKDSIIYRMTMTRIKKD